MGPTIRSRIATLSRCDTDRFCALDWRHASSSQCSTNRLRMSADTLLKLREHLGDAGYVHVALVARGTEFPAVAGHLRDRSVAEITAEQTALRILISHPPAEVMRPLPGGGSQWRQRRTVGWGMPVRVAILRSLRPSLISCFTRSNSAFVLAMWEHMFPLESDGKAVRSLPSRVPIGE